MLYKFIDKEIVYTGAELAPHWIYRNFDLRGDAIVSFIGPCYVECSYMVDLVDVKENKPIYSPRMLNFIAEFFDEDLEKAIYRQRLIVTIAKEEMERIGVKGKLIREGDDIYYEDEKGNRGKMSVSIATRSPVSTLVHFGVNVETEGVPVQAAGLAQIGIEPRSFANRVMELFVCEVKDIYYARCKVRSV